MEEFWKDDFRPLQWAGNAVLQALRDDEGAADADLYRRLQQSKEGSHLYFQSDSQLPHASNGAQFSNGGLLGLPGMSSMAMNGGSPFGGASFAASASPQTPPVLGLKHRQTLPLHPMLRSELDKVTTCSFMGLFLPVNMAWMTVDDKLFLFSSQDPARGTIQSFENPRKQPILTVALVKPKKGVFKDFVEWCLVVTTPEEIILLALAEIGGNHKIIPTSFMMASDMTKMACAAGTDDGRIFLGGEDGCVHEMIYEDETVDDSFFQRNSIREKSIEGQLTEFYDGTKVVPDVVVEPSTTLTVTDAVWNIGKRSFQTASGSESNPRKCRKLNVTSQSSSIVTALVPTLIRQTASYLVGTSTTADGIQQLVIDSQRKVMYSLSQKGWIGVFDISKANTAPPHRTSCDVQETVRAYLGAVMRGQINAPSTRSGGIRFAGGASAAQGGVGGMEGARTLLKQTDWQRRNGSQRSTGDSRQNSNGKSTNHPLFNPVSLHVVSPSESEHITLMAVTEGGLRLYFSALDDHNAGRPLSTNSRPRALNSKLTLCHIRSPPPLNMPNQAGTNGAASLSAAIPGGITPRMVDSRFHRVNASYYSEGQWVVAMADPSAPTKEDVVLAATPDIARRPRDGSDGGRVVSESAGGLSESVTFPIAATNEPGTGSLVSGTLSGGVVWEIASDDHEENGVLKLLMKSHTLTNAELELGLHPVYYPPSQIRPSTAQQQKNTTAQSSALVHQNASVQALAFQAAKNVFYNIAFARPLRHGLLLPPENRQVVQRMYRISRRTGIEGFSLTAAERGRTSLAARRSSTRTKRKQSKRQTKSSRVPGFVLQPPTRPLNLWTKQHLMRGKQSITLVNVKGIHKFEFHTVLSMLADALMAAGDNVRDNARITAFFSAYGHREGCAMCLALAVGCGPAEPDTANNHHLRGLASSAALARAHKPRLAREEQSTGFGIQSTVGSTNATDPCVPKGYTFRSSYLSDGLSFLVSRLLRPIWHKPLVVVTEGRSVQERWESTKMTPAKVEILMDTATLESIRAPLQSLLTVMRTIFSRAVDAVPGTLGQQYLSMDVDNGIGQSQPVTQALQYHSQFRSSGVDSTLQLTSKECDNFAHLLEERNIHSMFRLVSRAVQLLNLLSLLLRAEGVSGLPQVDWGLLHGNYVCQLVQSIEGHDRLETLLNEFVVSSASDTEVSPMTAQIDQLAGELSRQCYLFFPPSSRFTYEGLRRANQALVHPAASSLRRDLGAEAASRLIEAARHWHSASLITGRLVRGSGTETYSEIANRAIEYNSPLARATILLVDLEDVGNVVEICQTTSMNFRSVKVPGGSRDSMRQDVTLRWESELYHKHDGGRSIESQTNGSAQQASSELSYGNSVTSNDAIDTCYALVFYHLENLMHKNKLLADSMVSACAAVSDKLFLTKLFTFLLESSNIDTLLRVDSTEAELFLKKQDNSDLLCRYYSVQEKHLEGGRVAFEQARSPASIPLDKRIEWLTRAQTSFRTAQKSQRRSLSRVSDEELQKTEAEASDTLRVAALQHRVLENIQSLPENEVILGKAKVDELKTGLVDVNSLFHEFAAKIPLYDICLAILFHCRFGSDNPQIIRNIWNCIFCDVLLPNETATRDKEVFEMLQVLASGAECAERIVLQPDSIEDAKPIFEDGNWITPLKERIVKLGKEIYGTGADYTFPVDYIMDVLERVRSVLPTSMSPGWSLVALVEAGVPFMTVLATFDTVSQPHDALSHAAASIEFFEYWIDKSRESGHGAGQHSAAQNELSRSMSNGDLMNKLNALRSRLDQMQGPAVPMLDHLNRIELAIANLVSF